MIRSRAFTFAFSLTFATLGLAGCARHAAELQVRDQRISELETSLADTQGRFDEAQEQIVRLTSENQSLRQVVRGLSGDVEQLEANRQTSSAYLRQEPRLPRAVTISRDMAEGLSGAVTISRDMAEGLSRAGTISRDIAKGLQKSITISREVTEGLQRGFAISREVTEGLQRGFAISREVTEGLQRGFAISRDVTERLSRAGMISCDFSGGR